MNISFYTIKYGEYDVDFVRISIDNWIALAISGSSKDYPGLYRDGSRGDRLEIIGVDDI
jgi:hypothetical protein